MEFLSDQERTPRQYNKRNGNYWGTGIKEIRAKRHRLCNERAPAATDDNTGCDTELTPEIIKDRLKNMGIKTRARCMKRLQEIYEMALQSAS